MSALDDALAEAEQLDRIEHEFAEFAAKKNAEWTAQWPNHCKYCGGWGATGLVSLTLMGPASRSNTSSTSAMRCRPRCATVRPASTPTIRGTGECWHCGWYLNDGLLVT
jgi:hypothetical protein